MSNPLTSWLRCAQSSRNSTSGIPYMTKPLCFVLMPFGKKPDAVGNTIDFDRVYDEIIKPAIQRADMEAIRADQEMGGGLIHKPMFERLILCEYAVADLTTANANVFYELGVRHAVKPATTIMLFAADGRPSAPDVDRANLAKLLDQAKADAIDSPVYQLVEGFPDIQHIKTDVF